MKSKNQMDDMVQFLEQQIEERPQQAAVRRRLGEAYYLTGDVDKAIAQLNMTREILMETGDRFGAIAAVQQIQPRADSRRRGCAGVVHIRAQDRL